MKINTVLVIEDNPQNMYMMRFLLEKNGFTVLGSTTGEQGIQQALQHKPDLILLDIQLPEMDGYEVAKIIKADTRICSIPIIVVTSFAMPGDRQQAIASGADGYIEKPIDPATFIGTMLSQIDTKEFLDESTDSR
jgi:CheY-like chemotaxis protein